MRHDPAGALQPARRGWGTRPRGILVGAAVGLAVVLTASCSGSASGGGQVTSTVTIAAVPGVDTIPLWMAQKDNFFATEGLSHVVIKRYPSESEVLSALRNGQADIAASDYGDIFYAQATRGTGLRVLADGYDANPGVLEVLTLPGSGIRTPADLENRKVGVPSDQVLPVTSKQPVSLETAAANQILYNDIGSNGIDSITWDSMSQQNEIKALENHMLPAVLVTEPYIFQAQSQLGAVELLDAASGSTASLPLTGYVATSVWAGHNPAAVADFQAAIAQAQSQASMSNQVQQLLPAITRGVSTTEADMATLGTYPSSTSAGELQRVVNLLWESPWTTPVFKGIKAPKAIPMIITRGG
jgi:NitT/TauT family transport system substrate-binding protein